MQNNQSIVPNKTNHIIFDKEKENENENEYLKIELLQACEYGKQLLIEQEKILLTKQKQDEEIDQLEKKCHMYEKCIEQMKENEEILKEKSREMDGLENSIHEMRMDRNDKVVRIDILEREKNDLEKLVKRYEMENENLLKNNKKIRKEYKKLRNDLKSSEEVRDKLSSNRDLLQRRVSISLTKRREDRKLYERRISEMYTGNDDDNGIEFNRSFSDYMLLKPMDFETPVRKKRLSFPSPSPSPTRDSNTLGSKKRYNRDNVYGNMNKNEYKMFGSYQMAPNKNARRFSLSYNAKINSKQDKQVFSKRKTKNKVKADKKMMNNLKKDITKIRDMIDQTHQNLKTKVKRLEEGCSNFAFNVIEEVKFNEIYKEKKEGFLLKRGKMKRWYIVYCAISHRCVLFFTTKMKEKLLGCKSLIGCKVIDLSDKTFELKWYCEKIILKSDCKIKKEKWVEFFVSSL